MPAAALAWTSIGLSAVSGAMQAKAQRDQGKDIDQLAQQNAQQLEEDAMVQQMEALAMSREQRRQSRRVVEKEKTKFIAKSGVEFRGSPLESVTELVGDLELQALETERHGRKRVSNTLTRAANTSFEGKMARKGGNLSSIGTILQTVGNVSGQYAYGKQNIRGF